MHCPTGPDDYTTPYHRSTPAHVIDQSFSIDAHHQYRFAFGDLLCSTLQDHERKWKFDVKNDIGFYVGDEDSPKGGSLIYMPYTHKVLTRGGGHRILISDVQLLQWYARRRDITRNPLPYSTVKDAVMDLMANRDTTVIMSDKPQLLITPATEDNDTLTQPLTPAVIQHAASDTPTPARLPTRPRTALIPVPPTAALHRTKRDRSQTTFYKPHDIRAVTEALRTFMDRETPPLAIFPIDDNEHTLTDTDIMRSYTIDTLFDSEYYTGDTEEIETTDALKAPDSAQFITAIQKEVHSLITETRTLIRDRRLLRKHNKQAHLENTNDTQRRARQAQGPRRSPRRHTPTIHD